MNKTNDYKSFNLEGIDYQDTYVQKESFHISCENSKK